MTAAQALVVAGAFTAIVVFVVLAVIRIRYPFELEWLESEMLEHVRRLADGHPIYTAPTVELTQVPYAPLSFGLGALLSNLTGVHFWMMRGISVVATFGTLVLIAMMVLRETKSRFAAIVATGLYAASFRLTGTFYDIAKSDALFIFFAMASIYFARNDKRTRNALIAGTLMALAILTKQTAIFFVLPLALFLVVTKWRFGLAFSGAAIAVAGITSLILHVITDGWYTFFTWELLFEHQVAQASRVDFFTKDISVYIPVALIILLAAPVWLKRDQWWNTAFYASACGGLFAGAWTGRLHSGGYDNVLMPAALGASLLLGVAIAQVLQRPAKTYIGVGAVLLCALQLFFLRYDPVDQVPTKADGRTGTAFIAYLKTIPGDVWITRHPAYASMAGKPVYAGQGGIEDVLRGKDEKAKADLRASIANAIHTQRFSAIFMDGLDDTRGFPDDWQQYYEQANADVLNDDGSFHPVTNDTGRPKVMFVKRLDPPPAASSDDDGGR